MDDSGPARIEKELKFADVELETLREHLLDLEAERIAASAFEDNWIFDRGKELLGEGCVLRLRVDGKGGAEVCFKGPARYEAQTKVRLEYETRVEDAEQMRAIFERLGFSVERRYQKMREEWRLGGVIVALDHTPIGDFAEFEGEGGDKVARRCGFDPGAAEQRSYLELYEEHLRHHPDAPRDMVFP